MSERPMGGRGGSMKALADWLSCLVKNKSIIISAGVISPDVTRLR